MDENQTTNKLFWILQISGWISFYLIYLSLYYRDFLLDISRMGSLLITNVTGFFVTLILRYFYKKFDYDIKSIPQILLVIIILSILFANVWFWVDLGITHAVGGYTRILETLSISSYIRHIWGNAFAFVAWSALYFGIKFWFDFQTERTRTALANELAQKAQLQMLRYQLNPHFLFNSLNSIRALVEEDKNRAREMITELSEFLRYSLISKNYSNVPFIDELDAMKHYLAIEKTRYEENLIVDYDINPSAESYPVLSFLIHPIIENALKYGMKTSPKPLHLTISAKVEDEIFSVTICNTGKWVNKNVKEKSEQVGTGTGLDNVKRRLKNAFPGKHNLVVEKNDKNVCVRIEINN